MPLAASYSRRRAGKSGQPCCVARHDNQAMSSIGSPTCASSQSTIAVTRSPSYMKLPGPVSPWTSTGSPSKSGTWCEQVLELRRARAGRSAASRSSRSNSASMPASWSRWCSRTERTGPKLGSSSSRAGVACQVARWRMKSCATATATLGIARRPEPDLAFGPVDEEHVEVLVDAPDVRDRDAERLERAVHLGLAAKPMNEPTPPRPPRCRNNGRTRSPSTARRRPRSRCGHRRRPGPPRPPRRPRCVRSTRWPRRRLPPQGAPPPARRRASTSRWPTDRPAK